MRQIVGSGEHQQHVIARPLPLRVHPVELGRGSQAVRLGTRKAMHGRGLQHFWGKAASCCIVRLVGKKSMAAPCPAPADRTLRYIKRGIVRAVFWPMAAASVIRKLRARTAPPWLRQPPPPSFPSDSFSPPCP